MGLVPAGYNPMNQTCLTGKNPQEVNPLEILSKSLESKEALRWSGTCPPPNRASPWPRRYGKWPQRRRSRARRTVSVSRQRSTCGKICSSRTSKPSNALLSLLRTVCRVHAPAATSIHGSHAGPRPRRQRERAATHCVRVVGVGGRRHAGAPRLCVVGAFSAMNSATCWHNPSEWR